MSIKGQKAIQELTFGTSVIDGKSLLVIAPISSGSSTTDPTANTYADAVCIFVADLIALAGGGSAPSAAITASENLAAGDIVSIWYNSGTANVRKANATDATKPAHGFVAAAVASGSPATVFFTGQINTHRTGLTPGTQYWLDVSGGGVVSAAPSSAGNLVQKVGIALSATSLLFMPFDGVQL